MPCPSRPGGGILRVATPEGELLSESAFDPELALEKTDGRGLVAVVCTSDANRVTRLDAEAERVGARFLTPLRAEPNLPAAVRDGLRVTKLSIYGEVPRLSRLLGEIEREFGTSVTASFSDPDGIDVMPGGVDKGAGVRLLLQRLGLAPHEMACIGDSFNDLPMFAATPNSWAMAHADMEVRRRAAFETASVAAALARLARPEPG